MRHLTRDVIEIGAHHVEVVRMLHQEGIVTVRRGDLGIADVARLCSSGRTISRERSGEKRQSW